MNNLRISLSFFLILNCCNSSSDNTPSSDDAGTDAIASDAGNQDSSLHDAGNDAGAGTDKCDNVEFPPPNKADGCRRILLTKYDGTAFSSTSRVVSISRDGSLVAFQVFHKESQYPGELYALPDDTNEYDDIYAVDLDTMEMEIISVSSSQEIGNASSQSVDISADGRYVVFSSSATNFSEDAANPYLNQIYLRDRKEKTTTLVSLSNDNEAANAGCSQPVISATGMHVVFSSFATNLVADDTNGKSDLFVRHIAEQTTERITMANSGQEHHTHAINDTTMISDDGRYVLFVHGARLTEDDEDPDETGFFQNDVFLYDRDTKMNTLISIAPDGFSNSPSNPVWLSPDGRHVIFDPGQGKEHYHPDASDLSLLITEAGSDIFDIFIDRDLNDDEPYGGPGGYARVSTDKQYIVFSSSRAGFVENQSNRPDGIGEEWIENCYVYDRNTEDVYMVNSAEDGTPGVIMDYVSDETDMIDFIEYDMSGDGKRIAFSTIQYGIVDGFDIPCTQTPSNVYLRDCQ